MTKTDRATVTYEWKPNSSFLVDIVSLGNDIYEAWLYHKKVCVKELMFGCKAVSVSEFMEMVERNLNAGDYINGYYENWM